MRLLLSLVLLPGLAGSGPLDAAVPAVATAEPVAVLHLEPYRRTVAVRVVANGTPGLFAFDTAAGHTVA